MLKTAMGMLGEYEYDTVYNESDVPPITWAVYVAFLVINCVIIVNLLVSISISNNGVIYKYTGIFTGISPGFQPRAYGCAEKPISPGYEVESECTSRTQNCEETSEI
jgi:hypothetical protein